MGISGLIQWCCSQNSMKGREKQRKKKKKQGSSHEEGERDRGDCDEVHGIGVWRKSFFLLMELSLDYSCFPLINE